MFVDMVRAQPAMEIGHDAAAADFPMKRLPSDSNRPRDIPVYTQDLTQGW